MESENLRLCIDVQKALNRQDSTNLLLMQEKNTADKLNNQVLKMTQNLRKFESKDHDFSSKSGHLKIDSGVIRFYGCNFRSDYKIV